MKNKKELFPIGRTLMTRGVQMLLDENTLVPQLITDNLMNRHASGDWGGVDAEDGAMNDAAVKNGDRLLSSYTISGENVWVITDADRSITTVLLPSEY
jgi:hypothetical protein